MPDYGPRQLGCVRSHYDPRTIFFDEILRPDLPAAPAAADWSAGILDWGVMGNDAYGNCTIATAAHELITWRANESQNKALISDAAVIALSREMGALRGFAILDRLKYWKKHGMWANSLRAYAQIPAGVPDLIRHAINLLGAADIAIDMPNAWRSEPIWDAGRGRRYRPGSWGLHSVPLIAYDADTVTCVTWGQLQKITWDALAEYMPEAWAIVNPEWYALDGVAPSGLDENALDALLEAIAG